MMMDDGELVNVSNLHLFRIYFQLKYVHTYIFEYVFHNGNMSSLIHTYTCIFIVFFVYQLNSMTRWLINLVPIWNRNGEF